MTTKNVANALLKQARLSRRWTQRDVAEKVGVEPQTVRSWERGTRSPSPETRLRLCEVFGTSAEQLGLQTAEASETYEKEQTQEAASSSNLHRLDVVKVERSLPSNGAPLRNKNHVRMLKRVEMRWITDVLEPSLYEKTLILLSLREQPDAVENPWKDVVQETALRPGSFLPPGSHISEIYDEA